MSGIVNTAIAAAIARAIVVQYHTAFVEKRYSFADAGVGGSCFVKCKRSSFSSSISRLAVCSGGMAWRSCIRVISCFWVSGFSFLTVWMMRSLIWSFVA